MRAFGLISIVIGLCAGFFYYNGYFASGAGSTPPQQQIDVISIKSDLQAVGQSERQYLANHNSYATIDQLKEADLLPAAADRRGYTLTSIVDGNQGFTITATPSDPQKSGWPTLSINETLEVTTR
jgi:hypothetical protein